LKILVAAPVWRVENSERIIRKAGLWGKLMRAQG